MARDTAAQRLGVLLAGLMLAACGQNAPTAASAPLCPPQTPDAAHDAVDRMRAAILDGLALEPGMKVGDIGTGGGWFAFRIAQTIGQDGAVYATDIDAETISRLKTAPPLGANAAPLHFTLVTHQRDSGFEAQGDNSLDLMLMIDSLCFDASKPRADDVAYLRQFWRVLKPGGRLIHHMDCTCRTSVAATEALFAEAGFAAKVGRIPLTCNEVSATGCPSAEAQARALFVGVFRKP